MDLKVSRDKEALPKTENQQTLQTYQNEQEGISIGYPGDWRLQENPGSGVLASFSSPKETPEDQFVENANLSITNLSSQPDMTLEELADLWLEQSSADFPSGSLNLEKRSQAALAGLPAIQMIYSFQEPDIRIKGMAVTAIGNGNAYIFTYTAEEKSYDKFLKNINQILESVKID